MVSRKRIREVLERAFNRYYTRVEGDTCYYCSRPATGIDHAYPLSRIVELNREEILQIPIDLLVIVPCCTRCNSILWNKIYTSMSERKMVAQGWPTRDSHAGDRTPPRSGR